jgi:hypothetical protein
VGRYKNPKDACAAVVAEAYRLWLQYETRTDDITIIVVHIDGLKDVQIGALSAFSLSKKSWFNLEEKKS